MTLTFFHTRIFGTTAVGAFSAGFTSTFAIVWNSVTLAFFYTNFLFARGVRTFTTSLTHTFAVVVNNLPADAFVLANAFEAGFVCTLVASFANALATVWNRVSATFFLANALVTAKVGAFSASWAKVGAGVRCVSLTLEHALWLVAVKIFARLANVTHVLAHVRFGLNAPCKRKHCYAQQCKYGYTN